MSEASASLIEIFSAIQGEGINVGTRQIFIRFGGCDLRCHYCDSQHTWQKQPTCQIEYTPGLRDFYTHPNPVSLSQLLVWTNQQNLANLHDSISITGGEPLLHSPFLMEFLPQLKAATGLPIYLETGGHRPQQLAQIIDYLDLVGMDIKLPGVSGENRWEQHREFLQLCYDRSVDIFIKLIVSDTTQLAELIQTAELVRSIDEDTVIFLQPVTPILENRDVRPPTAAQVLAWQASIKEYLPHVRVIPQTHKFIGQL
jgi:7-carboxy-7-deazaguanine synthase